MLYPEQLMQAGRGPGGVDADLFESAVDPVCHGRWRVELGEMKSDTQNLQERMVRARAAVGEAVTLQVRGGLPRQLLTELEEDAGLADACLAHEGDQLPLALPGRLEAAAQEAKLIGASHEATHAVSNVERCVAVVDHSIHELRGRRARLHGLHNKASGEQWSRRLTGDDGARIRADHQRIEDVTGLPLGIAIDVAHGARTRQGHLGDVDSRDYRAPHLATAVVAPHRLVDG